MFGTYLSRILKMKKKNMATLRGGPGKGGSAHTVWRQFADILYERGVGKGVTYRIVVG